MAEVATASVRIVPNMAGFAAATQAGVGKSISGTAAAARTLGAGLSAAVTLPVAAIGVAAVKSFADFDQAMIESQAIMGDLTENQMAAMEQAARDVGKTTTFSATEAAESFFFLASAGLDAEQSIGALPAVAAFAQAGMFDMALATDLATDAQSALGLVSADTEENLENLTRVTDVLVGANTLANASVEQFSTSLTTKAGTALKLLNKDVEEGVAVLALYADQGIKGTLAGEQLSRTMKFLNIKAVENKEEFAALNIEVFDSEGKMRNMADIVDDLTGALGDMSDEERTAALATLGFSGRIQDGVKTLLGGGDAIREYESALRDMGGITQEVAEKQLQSFSAQLSLAKARITDAAISLGKVLAPVVLNVATFVAGLVDGFTKLPGPIKRFVGLVAGIAALSGPILLIGGSLAKSFLAIKSLSVGTGRGALQATQYAAAQARAAAATNAMAISAGRATASVGALGAAQARGAAGGFGALPQGARGAGIPLAGAAGGATLFGKTIGGSIGAGAFSTLGGGAAAVGKAGLFGVGGFLAGDLVGGLIQGIETEEGTVGDTVKDVTGNAVRFGATGAAIGFSLGGPIGAGVGGAIGAIGGGIAGFFSSNKGSDEIAAASVAVRDRIASVLGDLELSDREQTAIAQVLDQTVSSVIQLGINNGFDEVEAAGLGDRAEEVIANLLEFGVDPARINDLTGDIFKGLDAGLSPEKVAAAIATDEDARTQAVIDGLVDPDAIGAALDSEIAGAMSG
jgi:TP901 family phage tail tape measure protein